MAQAVSAMQGPLLGQVAGGRIRTVKPNPGLVNSEYFIPYGLNYLDRFGVLL